MKSPADLPNKKVENGESLLLAKSIAAVMDERNLTFKQLSVMAGVPVSTIADWANGGVPRNLFALRKLAQALNLSFSMMLFGEPEAQTKNLNELFDRQNMVDGVFEVSIKRLSIKKF